MYEPSRLKGPKNLTRLLRITAQDVETGMYHFKLLSQELEKLFFILQCGRVAKRRRSRIFTLLSIFAKQTEF